MIFVIGGAFQGKLDYVERVLAPAKGLALDTGPGSIVDGESCTLEEIENARVLNHFHLYVKRLLKEGKDPHVLAAEILRRNPDLVIVSNELGCGVVPVDAFEREYREAVGRVSCDLAKEASEVHRVLCGLGKAIKC